MPSTSEGTAQTDRGVLLGQHDPSGSQIYFIPNHLLHNLFGFLIYKPAHSVFLSIRTLEVLVAVNSLLSALTAALLFRTVFRRSHDLRTSTLLALLFAFSGTWWKFSTDANAYVPSVFFLVASASLLTDSERRPRLFAVALLHRTAILIHQFAVLFYSALLVALWRHPFCRRNRMTLFTYTVAAATPVLAAYLAVWFGVYAEDWSAREFLSWITYNGGDLYSNRSTLANLLTSVASMVRVFFGGRISLASQVVPAPVLFLLAVIMAGSSFRLFRKEGEPHGKSPPLQQPIMRFTAAWVGVFQLFVFFWLTEYPYYRLFCLPALILCVATALEFRPAWQRRLPALVLFVAAINFAFMIYPYSLPEATPPVRVASAARSTRREPALVLYREATCDNWFMRYFNPHTSWASIEGLNREQLSERIAEARNEGRTVWVDTTLLGHLDTNPELREWLAEHGVISAAWGLSNGRYHIQFAQLVPHP